MLEGAISASVSLCVWKPICNNFVFGFHGHWLISVTTPNGSPAFGSGSLNEDMTAKFDAQLPFGRYYVQEIATDEHYMLNGEKYLVNFEYMGQEVTTVSFDCGTFENRLKRGNANGYKVNEDDEPLAKYLKMKKKL